MLEQKIRLAATDIFVNFQMKRKRSAEIRKFKDGRRLDIANQYPLSKLQKMQIDDFFTEYYGEKVDYVWHQNYAAHAGRFDFRFFPELLFIPEFELFQNQNRSAKLMLTDKNFLPFMANSVGVKMPSTIVSCTNGVLRDGDNQIISSIIAEKLVIENGNCFVKPSVDSNSGSSCIKLSGDDSIHFSRNSLTIEFLYGGKCVFINDFVVQNQLVCHESIRALYAGSVNTMRVITYLWKGNIEVMPLIIRMGKGGHFLDNAHQGGIFCAVMDDGSMGEHAITEFNDQFVEHPDTHTVFAKHKIENINKVIEAAKKLHAVIPQVGDVNWDFTIDEKGDAVLIEANCKSGSVWLPQMAHGVSAFGDKTAEVLQWLKFMKKLPPHERKSFVGGYMD